MIGEGKGISFFGSDGAEHRCEKNNHLCLTTSNERIPADLHPLNNVLSSSRNDPDLLQTPQTHVREPHADPRHLQSEDGVGQVRGLRQLALKRVVPWDGVSPIGKVLGGDDCEDIKWIK